MLLKRILWMFFIGAKASIPNQLLFNLISGYITEENSKFCIFLLCWTDTEKVKLQKYIHSNGNVRTQFVNDEKHILEADFSFYNQVTLIIDFDCLSAEQLLQKVNYSSTKEEDYLGCLRAKERTEFQIFNFQLFLVLKEVHKFQSSFVFLNPGKAKPGLEILKPFSINTWYAFVLATIAIGFSIYLTYWTEFKFAKSPTKYSFCSSMLITISIIAQQGSAIIPLRICGRIIFLTLLIMSMMLYNYYTSSLVSSLLSYVPEPISTLKELYESDLKVALEPQPYVFTYILQQKDDKYISLLNRTKIYENGIPNIMSPIEGISKVKQGNYAYLTELATAFSCLADADQDISCDLADINFIPYGDVGFVVQKYSQYTELFHITSRKMLSSGIHNRIKEFWLSKRPDCLLSSRVKAVGVTELFLVYLIISGGILISIIILLLELLLNKHFHTNISRK